jgi:glycogen debranching enzyme
MAYALDGQKKTVLTIASNAGHCLWSGIVAPERAEKVVERLMAPDMWTGWGIRTLAVQSVQPVGTTVAICRHTEYNRTVLQVLSERPGNGFA